MVEVKGGKALASSGMLGGLSVGASAASTPALRSPLMSLGLDLYYDHKAFLSQMRQQKSLA